MHFVIFALLVLALLFAPQFWAKRVFKKYSTPQEHFPGTGGELARHLLDRFELSVVRVETTETGDHYDPVSKTVRLLPAHFKGKSLTAIAIAAHEVGHAIQDRDHHPMLALRTRLVGVATLAERIGSFTIMAAPLLVAATRSPALGLFVFLIGVGTIFVQTIVHLVTLPVEWDASFGKALPILREGYISEQEQNATHQILKAAALTYVAGSLASVLNLWRWLRVLRRR